METTTRNTLDNITYQMYAVRAGLKVLENSFLYADANDKNFNTDHGYVTELITNTVDKCKNYLENIEYDIRNQSN